MELLENECSINVDCDSLLCGGGFLRRQLQDPSAGFRADTFLDACADVRGISFQGFDGLFQHFDDAFFLFALGLVGSFDVWLRFDHLYLLQTFEGIGGHVWVDILLLVGVSSAVLPSADLDVAQEFVVVGEGVAHVAGLGEGHGFGQVHAHFSVFAEKYLADVFQMFYPFEYEYGVQLLADFLSDFVDVVHLLEAGGGDAEGVHPVVYLVGDVGVEPEIVFLESAACFVEGKHGICHVYFVADVAVGGQEEGDAREEQAEESAHVGEDGVDLAQGSGDGQTFGGFVDVDADVFGGGDGDGVGLEAVDVAAGYFGVGSGGPVVLIGLQGILRHVDVADSSDGLGEGHEDVLLQDLSDGVLVGGSDDGVDQEESDVEVVAFGQEVGDVSVDGGQVLAAGVQCFVALHYLEAQVFIDGGTDVAGHLVALVAGDAEHFVEAERAELGLESGAEGRPVRSRAGGEDDGRTLESRRSVYDWSQFYLFHQKPELLGRG